MRLTNPDFKTGPWNLKGKHKLVGWTALAWVGLITVLFFAPLFWPFWKFWGDGNAIPEIGFTRDDGVVNTYFRQNNANFTGPLIVLSFIAFGLYWRFSGKKWFTGPKVQGTKEELLAIERELEGLGGGSAPAKAAAAPTKYKGAVLAGKGKPPHGTVKGNESSMLYHLPDGASYDQTDAEYWFDSEASAKAAGFKKAKNS